MDSAIHVQCAGIARNGTQLSGPFDITLAPGQRWLLAGRNGTGKSTLLHALAATPHPPWLKVQTQSSLSQRIAYLPQHDAVAQSLNAIQYIDIYEQRLGVAMWQRVQQLLSGTDIPAERFQRPLGTLSGGERRLVTLARALAQPSSLLLLDEPFNHLDLFHVRTATAWIAAATPPVIFSSHDWSSSFQLATHVLALQSDKHVVHSAMSSWTSAAQVACLGVAIDAAHLHQ